MIMEWLGNGLDKLSNLDVWGVEKSSYMFKDLDAYFQQAASKGKKKARENKEKGGKKNGHKKSKKHVN